MIDFESAMKMASAGRIAAVLPSITEIAKSESTAESEEVTPAATSEHRADGYPDLEMLDIIVYLEQLDPDVPEEQMLTGIARIFEIYSDVISAAEPKEIAELIELLPDARLVELLTTIVNQDKLNSLAGINDSVEEEIVSEELAEMPEDTTDEEFDGEDAELESAEPEDDNDLGDLATFDDLPDDDDDIFDDIDEGIEDTEDDEEEYYDEPELQSDASFIATPPVAPESATPVVLEDNIPEAPEAAEVLSDAVDSEAEDTAEFDEDIEDVDEEEEYIEDDDEDVGEEYIEDEDEVAEDEEYIEAEDDADINAEVADSEVAVAEVPTSVEASVKEAISPELSVNTQLDSGVSQSTDAPYVTPAGVFDVEVDEFVEDEDEDEPEFEEDEPEFDEDDLELEEDESELEEDEPEPEEDEPEPEEDEPEPEGGIESEEDEPELEEDEPELVAAQVSAVQPHTIPQERIATSAKSKDATSEHVTKKRPEQRVHKPQSAVASKSQSSQVQDDMPLVGAITNSGGAKPSPRKSSTLPPKKDTAPKSITQPAGKVEKKSGQPVKKPEGQNTILGAKASGNSQGKEKYQDGWSLLTYLDKNKDNMEAKHISVVSKYYSKAEIEAGEAQGLFFIRKGYLRK